MVAEPIPRFSVALHGLRGIAAMIVLLFHVWKPFDPQLGRGPFAGSAAVSFFFVMSGLVLTRSIDGMSFGPKRYAAYLIRRAFRLLPLVAVMATIGGIYVRYLDGRMPYVFGTDHTSLTAAKWASGYLGISIRPNGPSWSIFVEMVGSILIPLFVFVPKRWLAATGLLLAMLSQVDLGLRHEFNFYLINFYLGVVAARIGPSFANWTDDIGAGPFWAAICGLVAIFYGSWYAPSRPEFFLGDPRANLVQAVCMVPIVAVIFYRPTKFVWLEHRWLMFLGDISFSLYLTHYILFELTFNAFVSVFTEWRAYPVAALVSNAILLAAFAIPLSWMSYRWIELPGMGLGKRLVARLAARPLALTQSPDTP